VCSARARVCVCVCVYVYVDTLEQCLERHLTQVTVSITELGYAFRAHHVLTYLQQLHDAQGNVYRPYDVRRDVTRRPRAVRHSGHGKKHVTLLSNEILGYANEVT
jgi:hypothetical protein